MLSHSSPLQERAMRENASRHSVALERKTCISTIIFQHIWFHGLRSCEIGSAGRGVSSELQLRRDGSTAVAGVHDRCQHICCLISTCGLWLPCCIASRWRASCQRPCEPYDRELEEDISCGQQSVAMLLTCGTWTPCMIGTFAWGFSPRPFGALCQHAFPKCTCLH